MPTSPYFAKDGGPLPGTTTILGRFKESGGLLFWAHKVGYEQGLAKKAPKLYETRDVAADVGTLTHALVEAHINGDPLPKPDPKLAPEDVARAESAFKQFIKWQKQSGLHVTSWEKPLISEKYRFGGTIDAMGENDNKISVVDWKTSSGTYTDHLLQGAAYSLLWEENYPEQPIADGLYVLRMSKDSSDWHFHHFDNLEAEKKCFLLLREAYELDKSIKKRIN